jgi:hypothetical protein
VATETVANGFVYIHNGSTSSDTITYTNDVGDDNTLGCIKIRAEKIERDIVKDIMPLAIVKASIGSNPETWFFDFQKVKEVITIHGYLADDTGDMGDKELKRNALKEMARAHGTKEVVWGTAGGGSPEEDQQKETIGINKVKVTENAKRGMTKYPVIISLIVGADKFVQS